MTVTNSRIWEIDMLRGVAIILMVCFHLIVDLHDFWNYPVDYLQGFWYYEGKLSAIMFVLLAGISATLNNRGAKRGVHILAWGLCITLVTYLYSPNTYIRYGILHLLGTCMLVYHWLPLRSALTLTLAGSFFIAIGQWTTILTPSHSWFLPLGMTPEGFASMDYYPFLPWAGVFFLGAALGRTLYPHRRPLFPAKSNSGLLPVLGRHSLFIYLVHQPLLLMLLWLYHR